MKQVNQLIIYVSRTIPFRSDLDGHLIRAAMVFTFFAFSIQKWSQYTAEMLVPLISHSPVDGGMVRPSAFGAKQMRRMASAHDGQLLGGRQRGIAETIAPAA